MKFFEFIRGEVNESSVRASDTGSGLSVLVVPTDNLAFMTATKGSVNITFNNCSLYEDAALFDGEAVEKTNIQVSCIPGKEVDLIEDITRFITEETRNKIMKFDVRSSGSTLKKASIKGIDDVVSKITLNPIVMSTGKKSKGNPEKEYQRSIAGIDFGEDLPSLDYNHEGLASYADGDEITAWNNAGTGGNTYSIVANVADPKAKVSSTTTDLAKTSALILLDDYFVIPNAYTVKEDYTLYMVVKNAASTEGMGVIYGDDEGDTIGMCFGDVVYDSSGGIEKATYAVNTLKVRHDGRTGEPASVKTDNTDNGTISYNFPEDYFDEDQGETCQVFVIRRDKHFNIYMHNRTGELVAFIPKLTISDTATGRETSIDHMTDGDLLIEQLGSGGGIVATSGRSMSFKGYLARFGVIENDIGTNNAALLAQDLFNLYNL
jgi:hypothetical protein